MVVGTCSRLTVTEQRDRAINEREFQRLVTDLAELFGWQWAHFRPAQTQRGWRTPVSGPLGQGWPDLTLVRTRDQRLLFAELKREGMRPTPEQRAVLDQLRSIVGETNGRPYHNGGYAGPPRAEVHVWHPSDLSSGRIAEVLR
jgi:hypothetical protein